MTMAQSDARLDVLIEDAEREVERAQRPALYWQSSRFDRMTYAHAKARLAALREARDA